MRFAEIYKNATYFNPSLSTLNVDKARMNDSQQITNQILSVVSAKKVEKKKKSKLC